MKYLLTLVSKGKFDDRAIDLVSKYLDIPLKKSGFNILNEDQAIQAQVSCDISLEKMIGLRNSLALFETDILITPTHNARKKLLIADMDSTIVTSETLDDLADHAGLKDKISAITQRAMNGELDFEKALDERIGLLKGLTLANISQTIGATKISPDAQTLVATMKQKGRATCVLVSGGFTLFTSHIAKLCGFDDHQGNFLHIDEEAQILRGTVQKPVLDKGSKVKFLNHYADQNNLELSHSMTIGDGANDLPMLLAAHNAGGLGIGYYPKPAVGAELVNVICHTTLKSALYAQGYHTADIQSL